MPNNLHKKREYIKFDFDDSFAPTGMTWREYFLTLHPEVADEVLNYREQVSCMLNRDLIEVEKREIEKSRRELHRGLLKCCEKPIIRTVSFENEDIEPFLKKLRLFEYRSRCVSLKCD